MYHSSLLHRLPTSKKPNQIPCRYRLALVALAGLILFIRVPTYFTHPQFWAEDLFLWMHVHTEGMSAIWITMAGYLLIGPKLIAGIASFFPTAFAPSIYIYASIVVTLFVVFLATSPRLDLPFKPIVALAIVAPMQGIYTLATLCNLQWVLPLGALLLLFMRPAKWPITILESAFLAIASLTGVFSVLLAPLFVTQTFLHRNKASDVFRRSAMFMAIVLIGAIIQGFTVLFHLDTAFLTGIPTKPFTIVTFLTMPLSQTIAPIGNYLFAGVSGAVLATIVMVSIVGLALTGNYRVQKLFIIFFGSAAIAAGMAKGGPNFDGVWTLRYFYIPAVLMIWFLCCLSHRTLLQTPATILAVIWLLSGVILSQASELDRRDLRWGYWSKYVDEGRAFTYEGAPPGWTFEIPAHSTK